MKTVHIGKGKDTLQEVPKAPAYLSTSAKKHYSSMGKTLCSIDRLKAIYLPALEIFAQAMAQYEWSTKEIERKNKEKPGSGYIQKFKSKATNISTEVVLRNDAISTLFKCFKNFGLDPKSDRDLGAVTDPNQLDIFKEFANKYAQ